MLMKLHRSFLLYLFQKKDVYVISSYCDSWSNGRSLKNIAFYYCGYINTATLLHSYSVTCNFDDFCHMNAELCIAWKLLSQVPSNSETGV